MRTPAALLSSISFALAVALGAGESVAAEPWSDPDPQSPAPRLSLGQIGLRGGAEYRANLLYVNPIALEQRVEPPRRLDRASPPPRRRPSTTRTRSASSPRSTCSTACSGATTARSLGDPGAELRRPTSTHATRTSRARASATARRRSARRRGVRLQPLLAEPIRFRRLYGEVITAHRPPPDRPPALQRGHRRAVERRRRTHEPLRRSPARGNMRRSRPLRDEAARGVQAQGRARHHRDEGLFLVARLRPPGHGHPCTSSATTCSRSTSRCAARAAASRSARDSQLARLLRPPLGQPYTTRASTLRLARAARASATCPRGRRGRGERRHARARSPRPTASSRTIPSSTRRSRRSARARVVRCDQTVCSRPTSSPTTRRATPIRRRARRSRSSASPRTRTWASSCSSTSLAFQTARAAAAGVEMLRSASARRATPPTRSTRAARSRTRSRIFPQFDVHPIQTLLLRGGVLMAWAPAPRRSIPIASLPRATALTIEDDLVNFVGGKPGSYYGTELDGRVAVALPGSLRRSTSRAPSSSRATP